MQGQRGNATVEYLAICMSLIIGAGVINQGAKKLCVENFKGETTENCDSITKTFSTVFINNLENIVTLINLPL